MSWASAVFVIFLAAAFGPCVDAKRAQASDGKGVRSQLSSFDDANNASASSSAEAFACYCKSKTLEQCPNNKYPKHPRRINAPRFFHPSAGVGNEGLCCKLDEPGMFDSFRRGYTKQDSLEKCQSEIRQVPPASCCIMTNPESMSMGVRVSQVRANFHPNSRGEGDKGAPYVSLNDILGSADFNGKPVSAEEARLFVKAMFPEKLTSFECQNDIDSLVNPSSDQGCAIRAEMPVECCCGSEEVTEMSRCLPAEGAATDDEARPRLFDANVETVWKHGHEDTRVTIEGQEPRELSLTPTLHMADPEGAVASQEWNWMRSSSQWTYKGCSQKASFVKVHEKRVCPSNSKSFSPPCYREVCHDTMQMMGRVPIKRTTCTKKTLQPRVVYSHSANETFCVETRWERRCPAGTGAYEKVIPEGQCMTAEAGLVSHPGLTYSCPAGTKSANYLGLGGSESYHKGCKCDRKCRP